MADRDGAASADRRVGRDCIERPKVVDPAQLDRIEAVHRGFLYQHLYAARCLLLTPGSDVVALVVEGDEDVEVVRTDCRTYVQVKSRIGTIGNADIADALLRFSTYRNLHLQGEREGACEFVIATNATPTPSLLKRLEAEDWPADVRLDRPDGPIPKDPLTPRPPADVAEAVAQCCDLAALLPFATLVPETLVWKLAGAATAAAAGAMPHTAHAFAAEELPGLFEQLLIQLQGFPLPPAIYRAQAEEPALLDGSHVRLVTGWSGAGKTAWVAQAALHMTCETAYLDVCDVPGPALASTLARELAAHLFEGRGGLGRVLLPGASGLEILRSLDRRCTDDGRDVLVVLDNVHEVAALEIATALRVAPGLRFVLLSQPGAAAAELAARLEVTPTTLRGWTRDTVAAEIAASGCRADVATCDALLSLTGGLPLYVRNAAAIAASEHHGAMSVLCAELTALTHSTQTAQELILGRLVACLPGDTRHALAILSLCDVALSRNDLTSALEAVLGATTSVAFMHLRRLRTAGALEVYGGDRLKVHDAVRLLGRTVLMELGETAMTDACGGLKQVLEVSLQTEWEYPKLRLYIRMLGATADARALVELGADEIFHELGLWPEIETWLLAAADRAPDPYTRFWALDGIAFDLMRRGAPGVRERLDQMKTLAEAFDLGRDERLAVGMKDMNLLAQEGRRAEALLAMETTSAALGDAPELQRIFRYNAAAALLKLGDAERAADEAMRVADEYFAMLGITPDQVFGRNPEALRSLLRTTGHDLPDDCKHLADCLDLYALAVNAAGRDSGLARVHAMKFYQLAHSVESLVRVGQDAVDESIGRGDFIGARQWFEDNILPMVHELKLAAHVVAVRGQYAVTLAYCGAFGDAAAELARLRFYEDALDPDQAAVLAVQCRLVARLRRDGPPPQWNPSPPLPHASAAPRRGSSGKPGRNDPCPCGSGVKYKKCHGR